MSVPFHGVKIKNEIHLTTIRRSWKLKISTAKYDKLIIVES